MSRAQTTSLLGLVSAQALREAAGLHGAGKFAEAEQLPRDALGSDQENAELWNARGVMMAAMHRYVDALWCYGQALTLNPNGAGVWTNLGNALTALKQLKTAAACHQRAISLAKLMAQK